MADLSAHGRQKAADDGKARPDGSYPARNRAELAKAILAFGRSKPEDRAGLKRFLIKRARELNAVSLLPDSWHVTS